MVGNIDPKGMPPDPFHRGKASGIEPARKLAFLDRRTDKGTGKIKKEIRNQRVIIGRIKAHRQDADDVVGLVLIPAASSTRSATLC